MIFLPLFRLYNELAWRVLRFNVGLGFPPGHTAAPKITITVKRSSSLALDRMYSLYGETAIAVLVGPLIVHCPVQRHV